MVFKNLNEKVMENKAVQFLTKKYSSIDELVYDYAQYNEEKEILETLIDVLEVSKDIKSFKAVASVIIDRRKRDLGVGDKGLAEGLQILGDSVENKALINVINMGLDFSNNSIVIHLNIDEFKNKKDVDMFLKIKLLVIKDSVEFLDEVLLKIRYIRGGITVK